MIGDSPARLRLGSLLMPSHPPEVSIHDGHEADLEEPEQLDALVTVSYDELAASERIRPLLMVGVLPQCHQHADFMQAGAAQ